MRIALLILAALLLVGCAHTRETRIYPLNARFQKVWPNKSDIEWFYAARGKREAQVLNEYGSPTERKTMPDGTVQWHYPWQALAELCVKDGIVVRVFYDAGY